MTRYDLQLKALGKQFDSTMNVFTNTIKVLEENTQKQEAVRRDIQVEIETLNTVATGVDENIQTNKRLLDKFKALIS